MLQKIKNPNFFDFSGFELITLRFEARCKCESLALQTANKKHLIRQRHEKLTSKSLINLKKHEFINKTKISSNFV